MPAIPTARAVPIAAPLKLDSSGCLAEDIPCRKCGYNLHGLSLGARCPECGTPVERSLQGDSLRFAEPRWMQTLASSTGWIAAATALGILSMLSSLVPGLLGIAKSQTNWGFFSSLVVRSIGLVGYWKLTTPDPVGLERGSRFTIRQLVRVALVAGMLQVVLARLIRQSSLGMSGVVGVVGTAISIVTRVAELTYVRRLAQRIPDDKLAGSCRVVMWGMVVVLGLELLKHVAAMCYPGNRSLAGGFCVFSVGGIFFFFWMLHLYLRLRQAFKKAARQAATAWAAALATGALASSDMRRS